MDESDPFVEAADRSVRFEILAERYLYQWILERQRNDDLRRQVSELMGVRREAEA